MRIVTQERGITKKIYKNGIDSDFRKPYLTLSPPRALKKNPISATMKRFHKHIPNTNMTIETCIAHAIHKDLDIIEALPEVQDLPVEQLETYVESFVLKTQEALCSVIEATGDKFIRAKDAAGLCASCMESGINLPPRMMLRMCQTIIQLSMLDAKFILDTPNGTSLYYVRMALA